MPKRRDLESILVIGSGPIVIGQAAEFDYSGTQACHSLREEGYRVILLNSNPATIMTDPTTADRIYWDPLTVESLVRIIVKERPDAILPSLGGQTALNLTIDLERLDVLREYDIEVIGANLNTIHKAEDRGLFKELMEELREPIPRGLVVNAVQDALPFATEVGYPIMVRPAFTLGGSGGGLCVNEHQLAHTVESGLELSPVKQCLLEASIAGWLEFEFEVMRDSRDQTIVVCAMENIDAVGVHTGDSIVVAPIQTLNDQEYQMLRRAAIRIIRALAIEGGCNIQFAMHPVTRNYVVIEVNPRVSRSSALASKATGYPIAKIAAKLAVGMTLDEIINPVTGQTTAYFEPVLDYVVTKIPRWPFDKFSEARQELVTQMQATGEVMAIGRSFSESLLKAVRSLDLDFEHLADPQLESLTVEELEQKLRHPDDQRLFIIAAALRRGIPTSTVVEWTQIVPFFVERIQELVQVEQLCQQELGSDRLRQLKYWGFSDAYIAERQECTPEHIESLRRKYNIQPVFKTVDTCAGEFAAVTPYFYSTYDQSNEAQPLGDKAIIVLGSGPIRIGQGIEFDYATVHCVQALRALGWKAIVINNNPETVSTDFALSDRLYFEPLTPEHVCAIIDHEKPYGVMMQFGGQTALNLTEILIQRGVKILGSSWETIRRAEDRCEFRQLIQDLKLQQPMGATATSLAEARDIVKSIGYPVVVRPSYVLGGRAMQIAWNEDALEKIWQRAQSVHADGPILIDQYATGKEVEIDAICDGEDVLIPGIMEHIERAGVHSGDSMAVLPPVSLTATQQDELLHQTRMIARALKIRGLINLQLVITEQDILILEVNPRASRALPFLCKVTGVPMATLATQVMLGTSLHDLGYKQLDPVKPEHIFIKAPVFSFHKLSALDTVLGPEMKSTGEVMGEGATFEQALHQAFTAAGIMIPPSGKVIFTVADRDKAEALPIARAFADLGFEILTTAGTADYFAQHGLMTKRVAKLNEPGRHIIDHMLSPQKPLVINTVTTGSQSARHGYMLRRAAANYYVPCLTSLDTAKAVVKILSAHTRPSHTSCEIPAYTRHMSQTFMQH